MLGLIDTHFHIDKYQNYAELYKYIDENKQYTLCMTNSPGVFLSCKRMFKNSRYIKFAIGFHPLENKLDKRELDSFIHLLPQTDYVGEIGLDFTRSSKTKPEKQVEYFEKIVNICCNKNKLMSVHVRGAEAEALDILERYGPSKCIIHWYTGNIEYQKRFTNLGCYYSVNANMIKNMDIIRNIPQDKLLIESDGPYSKVNGKRFNPQLLWDEYELIAKALNQPDLIKTVFDNFETLLSK